MIKYKTADHGLFEKQYDDTEKVIDPLFDICIEKPLIMRCSVFMQIIDQNNRGVLWLKKDWFPQRCL